MLPDEDRTKEQLINELAQMRQRIAELEASETERKQAEAVLRESERKYRTLVEEALVGIVNVDIKGKITYVNETVLQSTGYSREEMVGKNAFRIGLITRETVGVLRRRMKEKLMGKPPGLMQVQFRCKNGEWIWLQIKGKALWEHGMPVGVQIIGENITERRQAEETLRKSERQASAAIEAARALTFNYDIATGKIEWGGAIEEITGYTRIEFAKIDIEGWANRIHPDDRDEVLSILQEAMGKDRATAEYRFEAKKGYITLSSISLTEKQDGKAVRLVGILQDITERKRAEEALQTSAQQWRATFDAISDAVCLLDMEGKILRCNIAMTRLLGKPFSEIIGSTCWELMHGTSGPIEGCPIVRMRQTLRTETLILPIGDRWFEVSADPLLDDKGSLIGSVHTMSDITERKRVEEVLLTSERKYRTFVESSHEVVFNKDRDGCYHTLNLNAAIGLGGTCIEDIEGKNDYDLLPKEQADALRKTDEQIMKSGKPVEVEEVVRDAKGENRVYLSYKWPTYDDKGRIAGISCFATDITERKQAEEELRESEERYRALMSMGDRVGEAVIMLQDNEQGDGIHTFVSDQWPRITGYSREELLGMSFFDLVRPEYRQASRKRHKRKMSGESIPGLFEMSVIRKDGAEVPVEVTSAYTTYRGEYTNVAFIRDITERKRVEEEVASLAKFPSENPNPVLRIAQNGTILYANKASLPLFSIWGCRVGQLLPDYLLQPVLGVLDSGLHKYIEVECGERTFSFMSSPIVDAGYVNLYGRDITDFKRAEVEKMELEQKAQLASRLASVGEMAAGVAHEINNPLTGVIGFAQLLMRKNIPDDIKDSVKVINDGAQRVADIINRLLTFARQRKPERGYVDINEIIETTLSLRAYEMETANIKVTPRLAPDLPRTMADSGQLQQLFLNIIINAETEMKLAYGRGSLLIKTETIGSSISISFKDDGPGIAKKNLGRIFDPFFTTREVGSGTGLGLSLCHGIVAEHNGYIYARSRLGNGATFVVELPIVIEDKQLGLPEPTAEEAERVAGAKILVVDDEPAVLKLLEQVLTDEGHEVVTTDHADDALNKIKRGQYNLILLDIKLPGMSGIELYKRIQKVSGSLASRVIFITGDIMGADTRDFFSQTKAHYITKPLDIEQLKREIDSQLYQGA